MAKSEFKGPLPPYAQFLLIGVGKGHLPQLFADTQLAERGRGDQWDIEEDDREVLQDGNPELFGDPDNLSFWPVWESVLRNARFKATDGTYWKLWLDEDDDDPLLGNLWAVPAHPVLILPYQGEWLFDDDPEEGDRFREAGKWQGPSKGYIPDDEEFEEAREWYTD